MRFHKMYPIFCLLFCVSNSAITQPADSLNVARERVVQQYISDLGKADAEAISGLFSANGIVISTSRGKSNAKQFFNAFLTTVSSAKTEMHRVFSGKETHNALAARFHFKFKMKDGETGEGEYMDEFVFADHSEKLSAVYMFENLKDFYQSAS